MISTKYPVYVNFVEKKKSKDGSIYTRFVVGDKIKDGDTYQNYRVTVWDDLNINNKDKVQLTSIDRLEAQLYKGTVYYSFVATVDSPKQAEPKPVEKDDTELPFDI